MDSGRTERYTGRMEMRELTTAEGEVLDDINSLVAQLLHDKSEFVPLSGEDIARVIGDPNTVVVVVEEGGRIIGMGLLLLANKFRGRYAYIEDMIVDEAYRGKGIGARLMERLIASARERGVRTIELSTRPSRESANALYKKCGFTQKETNVYRLKL